MDYDVLSTHGVVCPTGGVHWVQSLHIAWLERARAMRPPLSIGRLKQRINPLHPEILRLEERHFRARSYKRLIATTPVVRADLHRFYNVPEKDVAIIPNGFNPNEFSPAVRAAKRDEMRRRLGLEPDQIVLLLVANELERKGYRTILKALRILDRRDIRLMVVGRPSVSAVKRLASLNGVSDLVMACGASQSVADYHAAADLFVMPTEYEAFSLAILESLASGLPVVTTRVPGAQDAIQDGVNGALVRDPKNAEELAAALLPLLDAAVRENRSLHAPESVRQYAWPVVLEQYERELLIAAGMTASINRDACQNNLREPASVTV
jgi:UDP-glucose:(heptosyl)LPS alpha-1,3-glucosyltransferase